jgi:membrane associated rhomboid family serine protease
MIDLAPYQAFLARVSVGLAAAGCERLLAPGANPAPWAIGWDQVVLSHAPGEETLVAFTRWDGQSMREMQQRVDRLVTGLSQSGALHAGPLRLVSVIVLPEGAPEEERRRLTRLAPSLFVNGLRPVTWLVDLAGNQVTSSRRSGNPAELDVVRAAVSPDADTMDAAQGEALRRQHSERMHAFHGLMRGRQPWVTYALVALNSAIFLLTYLGGPSTGGETSAPRLIAFGALVPQLVLDGQWWRLFTAVFLHASIQHILFNMTSLLAVGTLAERLYGSVKFIGIYLGAGLIGSIVSLAFAGMSGTLDVPGVGASGAIFGVAGALVTVRFQSSEIIPRVLRDRVSNTMIPLIGISLIFAYLTPYVDNAAHVGGLLGGMLLSFLFPLTRSLAPADG